jgi:DNA ligase-1
MIASIINELCENNGSNYKIDVLKKYKSNELLQRVLKMTYDSTVYRYYLTMNHWNNIPNHKFETPENPTCTFNQALDFLEFKLATRELTGNAAIDALNEIFNSLSENDRSVIVKIVNRDLRINCGRTSINKVFGNLITKPVYMRCGVFSKKNAKDISYPALIQLKADGTYREMKVLEGKVELFSRSGEQYFYEFENNYSDLPDGHYTGELIVEGTENRALSNGLLNSDNPPVDKIIFYVWDYITGDEYSNAVNKVKNTLTYADRLAVLRKIVEDKNHRQLQVIESHEVVDSKEAFEKVIQWMEADLEGGVLKDKSGLFRDGTSKHQLKMKLEMDLEVRVTGFKEGKIGTKRAATFGAINFETDDGMIKGSTSGFSDEMLTLINSDRDFHIGKIMTVSCNDITKGRDSDHYALSHPRFKEFRDDRDDTDTLVRALEIKQMSTSF